MKYSIRITQNYIYYITLKFCKYNIKRVHTEKNISEFFLFFIGILPQGVETRKICYLKGSMYYRESEITG